MKLSMTLLFVFSALGCKSSQKIQSETLEDDTSHHHHGHYHYHAVGGEFLHGYPWGLFPVGNEFGDIDNHEKRVNHAINDQEVTLANRIFEGLASGSSDRLLSFPLSLKHEGYRPFGDGQANAHADFSAWQEPSPPYLAVLDPTPAGANLSIFLHKKIAAQEAQVELSILGNTATIGIVETPSDLPAPLTESYDKVVVHQLDQQAIRDIQWHSLRAMKFAYFRPKGWDDWFALTFGKPFRDIAEITQEVPVPYKSYTLKSGETRTIPNATKTDARSTLPPLLQLEKNKDAEDLWAIPNDFVHSWYPNRPNQGQPNEGQIRKTAGGNWTFLLEPNKWEGPSPQTFKQLLSCFPGRSFYEESMLKAVSGTSWHNVGDPGEYLLNSVKNETRSLIAAIGVEVPDQGQPDHNLAYQLHHVGFSGVLEPGMAFLSFKGQYHWHPVHTTEPVCIEVWTPMCEPRGETHYGMACD